MRFARCIPKNTPQHLKYMIPRAYPRQSSYANVPQVYVTVELPLLISISACRVFILLLIVFVFLLMTLKESLFDVPLIVKQ
jgi:hypothetical protein